MRPSSQRRSMSTPSWRIRELLGPADIVVTRDLDDDMHLFHVARVRRIEATDTYLADARRTRRHDLRSKRRSAQEERRREEMERAVQEAKKLALDARMAEQIVVPLNDLPHGREPD